MSISPYLTGSFVDFMINNKDVHRVVYLSSIIMLIGIAGVVLAYCKNTLSVKITSQVSFDLLRDITKHFEKVKLSIVETIDEYSCAMKSHFRKFGNQMSGSGNHLCNYASLLA